MADLTKALADLDAERAKLEAKRLGLIADRKKAVGDLAEKAGVLAIADDILVGAFGEIATALRTNDQVKLQAWAANGGVADPRKRGRKPKAPKAAAPPPPSAGEVEMV
ncbi:MAG: hypothetical protein HQL38_11395 [Alphaproteobacteria bacterium]|nr:hypothetical protein [Alphaproteobacteria bacterium]